MPLMEFGREFDRMSTGVVAYNMHYILLESAERAKTLFLLVKRVASHGEW